MCPIFVVLLLLASASVAGSRCHTFRNREEYPCQRMQEVLKMEQTVNDCCSKHLKQEDGRPMYCCWDGLFDELRDPLLDGHRMPLWDCNETYNVSQEMIIGAIRCAQRKMNATDICRMDCCEAFWNEDATETHCSKLCMRLSSFTALSREEHLELLREADCYRNGGFHFRAFKRCLLLRNDDDDDEKLCVAKVLQG